MKSETNRSYAVPIIIFINIAIFALWNFPIGPSKDPEFMVTHFLVSWSALQDGRYWVLLTSVFSHNTMLHLFMNMFVLNSFGGLIEQVLGTRRFINFYLVAGIFSSLCHALVSAYILNEPSLPALGASGAISGIVIIFSFLFPKDKILILGIVPVPAFWGAILFIGLDVWGLIAQAGGGGLPIGHGAHLGGAFLGILYFMLFIRPKIKHTTL